MPSCKASSYTASTSAGVGNHQLIQTLPAWLSQASLRHWTTASSLTILAEKDFNGARNDGAESGRIAEVPMLLPTQLLKPGKAFRQAGYV